jgi:hypothetical protein
MLRHSLDTVEGNTNVGHGAVQLFDDLPSLARVGT